MSDSVAKSCLHSWHCQEHSVSIVSWRGFAFEEVCLLHINQIKQALGIQGVSSRQSSWAVKGNNDEEGTQIDLIIERADHIVNLCEMKFYGEKYSVDKAYYQKMNYREKMLTEKISHKDIVHPILVTTYGLTYNEYSGIFQHVITLDDLFKE